MFIISGENFKIVHTDMKQIKILRKSFGILKNVIKKPDEFIKEKEVEEIAQVKKGQWFADKWKRKGAWRKQKKFRKVCC